jgi:arginase family enzyme
MQNGFLEYPRVSLELEHKVERLLPLLRPAGGGLYLVSTGLEAQRALQRRFYDAATDADITEKFKQTLSRIVDAKVVVLGVPSDVGAGFRRGANLGPQYIREALLAADASYPEYCQDAGIVDIGDVIVVPQLLHDEMLSESQIASVQQALYPELPADRRAALPVSPLSIAEHALRWVFELNPGVKPLVLGGDHSCAWPVVSALHNAGKRFSIVQSDAHTDLMSERMGIRVCFATWTFHANELIGRNGRVIQVGIRASRFPKEHWEEGLSVRQFWAEEVRRDPGLALEAVVASVRACCLPVYFSNDIDGTDAAFADATGTPEPDGLAVDWLLALIERLGREVGFVGADLMEVAPLLGAQEGRITLETSVRYVRASLNALLAPAPRP